MIRIKLLWICLESGEDTNWSTRQSQSHGAGGQWLPGDTLTPGHAALQALPAPPCHLQAWGAAMGTGTGWRQQLEPSSELQLGWGCLQPQGAVKKSEALGASSGRAAGAAPMPGTLHACTVLRTGFCSPKGLSEAGEKWWLGDNVGEGTSWSHLLPFQSDLILPWR